MVAFAVEKQALETSGGKLEAATLERMEARWQAAKAIERVGRSLHRKRGGVRGWEPRSRTDLAAAE